MTKGLLCLCKLCGKPSRTVLTLLSEKNAKGYVAVYAVYNNTCNLSLFRLHLGDKTCTYYDNKTTPISHFNVSVT